MSDDERAIREKLGSIIGHINFTPIEKLILYPMLDGQKHQADKVVSYMGDSQATRHNLAQHIARIRKKLAPVGHAILCTPIGRRILYQYVILLSSLIPAKPIPIETDVEMDEEIEDVNVQ